MGSRGNSQENYHDALHVSMHDVIVTGSSYQMQNSKYRPPPPPRVSSYPHSADRCSGQTPQNKSKPQSIEFQCLCPGYWPIPPPTNSPKKVMVSTPECITLTLDDLTLKPATTFHSVLSNLEQRQVLPPLWGNRNCDRWWKGRSRIKLTRTSGTCLVQPIPGTN